MSKSIDFRSVDVEILLINGSPRPKSNTKELLDQVRDGVRSVGKARVAEFTFQNTHFGEVGFEDSKNSFAEFLEKWKSADGIIFAAPIYTASAPGVDYTALDLLEDALADETSRGEYKKVGAALIQGSAPWGLQELGAQHIIERFVALHIIPVERLVGRVVDKERPDKELLDAAYRFGQSVAEHAKLVKSAYLQDAEHTPNILLLNAGVENSNVGNAIEARAKSVLETSGANVITHTFVGKKLEGCRHCIKFCGSKGYCQYDDDFTEFLSKWLRADGYLVIASADTLGPPAIVRRALDRLSEHVFQTGLREHRENGVPPFHYPRYSRPTGTIAYGKRRYGGQVEAIQTLIAHDVHRGNYPIGGRDPHSPLGAAGFIVQVSQLGCNQFFTTAIDNLSEDVASFAARILTAKKLGFETIPEAFYASRTKMGVRDKETDYMKSREK